MNFTKSKKILEKAYKLIPSGSQTFSKGPSQWVNGASPSYLTKGKGAWVWDVDGNKYIDYTMALGSVTMGYGNERINQAILNQLSRGANFSMMNPLEVDVAEKVTKLVPCAEMVRFGKNGSDATSAMVRVSRAYTKRDRVAVCGYHGWHDWFIGSTSRYMGVPSCVQELTSTFEYNNIESLEKLLLEYPGEFALIMLEPLSFTSPNPGFLEGVRDLAKIHGAVFGFDEVVSGFRVHSGGAQSLYGITPDIASFGKGMANGLPLSCVAGRKEIMHFFDDIFFSSTFGGETISLAAASEFLDIIYDESVLTDIAKHGNKLKNSLELLIEDLKLNNMLSCVGHGSHWGLILHPSKPEEGLLWRSYLIQECIKRGYLFFGSHNPTPAHGDVELDYVMNVYEEVLPLFLESSKRGDMNKKILGEVISPIFRVQN
jgi:glutamate-1-semialdehyde 2,1-aminomutase